MKLYQMPSKEVDEAGIVIDCSMFESWGQMLGWLTRLMIAMALSFGFLAGVGWLVVEIFKVTGGDG